MQEIIARLGLRPRDLVRTQEPAFKELNLNLDDDAEVTASLSAHPILMERPIVLAGNTAIIARPPEKVLQILDT